MPQTTHFKVRGSSPIWSITMLMKRLFGLTAPLVLPFYCALRVRADALTMPIGARRNDDNAVQRA